jgi:hypothetical protein
MGGQYEEIEWLDDRDVLRKCGLSETQKNHIPFGRPFFGPFSPTDRP